ncbi:MAG: V-type ATP synthase subunit D [bacterium]
MAKIKLTRNELKSQRESLARYTRFLPTLELKKMQLEVERRKIVRQMKELKVEMENFRLQISTWQKLFGEAFPQQVNELVHLKEVISEEINVAGIFMPSFKDVIFNVDDYDKFLTPPWFDSGVKALQELIKLREKFNILKVQEEVIIAELRKTTQRINLFKERLIPECKDNIRQIRIYLGDVQAAAVGRAKIAKQKMQK